MPDAADTPRRTGLRSGPVRVLRDDSGSAAAGAAKRDAAPAKPSPRAAAVVTPAVVTAKQNPTASPRTTRAAARATAAVVQQTVAGESPRKTRNTEAAGARVSPRNVSPRRSATADKPQPWAGPTSHSTLSDTPKVVRKARANTAANAVVSGSMDGQTSTKQAKPTRSILTAPVRAAKWLWEMWFATAHMYSAEAGARLREYRYRAMDLSPVTYYVMEPYWRWVCATLTPLWVAPNAITLAGLLCTVFALGAALPTAIRTDFAGPVPAWVALAGAAAMWTYSTLDNVDGKQARRTGSSSPLGELFDHGCDALNCAVGTLLQAACVGLGRSVNTLALVAVAFWAFYLPTWEEYHTGVFVLGYVNGPTEGLLLAVFTMAATAFVGSETWRTALPDGAVSTMTFRSLSLLSRIAPAVGLSRIAGAPPHPRYIDAAMLAVFVAGGVFLCMGSVFVVVQHYALAKDRDGMRGSRTLPAAMLQLLIPAALTAAVCAWLGAPSSAIMSPAPSSRSAAMFVLFWLAFGFGFSSLVSRMIHAHLTRGSFPRLLAPGLLPLFAGALAARTLDGRVFAAAEPYVLGGWLVLAAGLHVHLVRHAVRSVCGHMGIRCLTIPRRLAPVA